MPQANNGVLGILAAHGFYVYQLQMAQCFMKVVQLLEVFLSFWHVLVAVGFFQGAEEVYTCLLTKEQAFVGLIVAKYDVCWVGSTENI